jgi:hypothetical protein
MLPTVVSRVSGTGFSCGPRLGVGGGVGFHVPQRWIFHVLGDGSRSLHVLTQYLTTNRLDT